MAKKKRTGRMISVPSDLNNRMSKAKDVNWSAVACEAFEIKLGEIAKQKENKAMTDVIDRLRASKRQGDNESFKKGLNDGREWASDMAEAAELERLERFLDDQSSQTGDWDWWFEDADTSTAEALSNAIGGEDGWDAVEFWERAVGDFRGNPDMSDGSYLRGFAEGAINLWDEVKEAI